MATFKYMVRKDRKRKDGTYQVNIRVVHNRKSGFIATGIYVGAPDLTKKLNITNRSVTDRLEDIVRGYRNTLLRYDISQLEVKDVIGLLKKEDGGFKLDILEYMDVVAGRLSPGTAQVYRTAKNAIVKFGYESLPISLLTRKFLEDFKAYLEYKGYKRAGSLYMSCVKKVFNAALREFNGENIDDWKIRHNPFRGFEMPVERMPEKYSLSKEQMQVFIRMKYPLLPSEGKFNSRQEFARDMFILSFCLMGTNTADLFYAEKNQLKNGIFSYKRRKTKSRRRDEASFSVRIEPEVEALMKKYEGSKYLFNFREHYATPVAFNWAVNCGLGQMLPYFNGLLEEAGLEKADKLIYYTARHTMATLTRNDLRTDKFIVHEMLNHASDRSTEVTDRYITKDWSILWDTNRKLLDYVFTQPMETGHLERTSGYKGVSAVQRKNGTVYRVTRFRDGKRYELGIFKNMEDAVKVSREFDRDKRKKAGL